jgi:hypothetical protein
VKEIIETLRSADNEGTDSPYWLIIDPSAISDSLRFSKEDDPTGWYTADLDDDFVIERIESMIVHCITGPFFSRKDAEDHLKARHYGFSKKAYVYCHSGYWSRKYKTFWKSIDRDPSARKPSPEKDEG